MPDEFKIKISADAGEFHAAATGAAGALDNLKSKTDAAGKSAAGSSELFKHFEHEGENTRKTIGELAQAFPGLEAAMKVIFNPASGLIFAAVEGYSYAREKLAAYEAELDAMIAKNAEGQFTDAILAHKKALDDAAVSLAVWRDRVAHAADAQDRLSQALARGQAIAAAMNAGEKSIAQSALDLDNAKIQSDYDRGLISYENMLARMLALKLKNIQDIEKAEERQRNDEKKRIEDTYNQELSRRDELNKAAEDATKAAADAHVDQEDHAQRLADAQKDQADKLKQLNDLQNLINRKFPRGGGNVDMGVVRTDKWFTEQYWIDKQRELENLRGNVAADQETISRFGGANVRTGAEHAALLDAKAKMANDAMEKLANSLDEHGRLLQQVIQTNATADAVGRSVLSNQIQSTVINDPLYKEFSERWRVASQTLVDSVLDLANRINSQAINGR